MLGSRGDALEAPPRPATARRSRPADRRLRRALRARRCRSSSTGSRRRSCASCATTSSATRTARRCSTGSSAACGSYRGSGRNRPVVVLAAIAPSGDDGARMTAAHATRRVVLLAFDRLQALDLVGPAEVFSMASRLVRRRVLDRGGRGREARDLARRAACTSGPTARSRGLPRPDRHARRRRRRGRPRSARATSAWSAGSRRPRARSRRVASVCNGAFLLAARRAARRPPRDDPLGGLRDAPASSSRRSTSSPTRSS